MIRVFPRRTKWTPTDELAFVGDPPLWMLDARYMFREVHVSVTFTWDKAEGYRLYKAWGGIYDKVYLGGPAFGDPGEEFTPGRFVKEGVTVTSRGCPKSCGFCFVPHREGRIRELQIKDGWNVFDNNLLACSRVHVEMVFDMLRRQKHQIHLTGGLDKTLLQPWHVDLLKSIRLKRAWFALDGEMGFPALERAADLLSDLSREKKYCYALVGFLQDETPAQAEKRLERIFNLGFMPFSMLYRGPDTEDKVHRDPAWRALIKRWCNPVFYKAHMKEVPGE